MSDDNKANLKSYHGHRKRLRNKMLSVGATSFSDSELLEIFLHSTLPRRDTKQISRNLIQKFDTIDKVVFCNSNDLRTIPGIGDATISALISIREVLRRTLLRKLEKKDVISDWKSMMDYLHLQIAQEEIEHFIVLYLNAKNHLIKSEFLWSGTVDRVYVHYRELIKKSLNNGASGLVIAHNHPSGDCSPSDADIDLTENLNAICRSLNIKLIDHIIVSREGFFSFRDTGILM